MSVSAVDCDVIVDKVQVKEPIYCPVSEEESAKLFRQIGLIARWVRNYIFPLSRLNGPYHQEILKRENWISQELFWSAPFGDLRYPKQKEVRDTFYRYNRSVIIQSGDQEIEMNCRVIETKGCPEQGCLNHIIVHGNISTLDNNMAGLYPLLEAYVKEKEIKPDLPPARFILVNHYGNRVVYSKGGEKKEYYPGNLEEWSLIFKKTLESFVNRHGPLHLLAGHSLGSIPVVEYLNSVHDEEFIKLCPKTLFVAQGPSSLYELSANMPLAFEWYPWGRTFLIGWVAYHIFKWFGWNIQLDKTLADRFQRLPKTSDNLEKLRNTNIVITGVIHDFFFPGKASLCASDQLERLSGIVNLSRMTFNPPLSWSIPKGQHNYNMGLLQRQDLVQEKLYYIGKDIIDLHEPKKIMDRESDHHYSLHHGESLVQAVLRSAWTEDLSAPEQSVGAARKIVPITAYAH